MSGHISWWAKNANVPRKSDVSIRLWDLVDIPSGQLRHASQMSLWSLRTRARHVATDDDKSCNPGKRYYAPRYLAYASPHTMSTDDTLSFSLFLSLSLSLSSCAYAPIISLPAPPVVSLLTPYLTAGHTGRYNLPKDPRRRPREPGGINDGESEMPSSHPRRNVVIINIDDRGRRYSRRRPVSGSLIEGRIPRDSRIRPAYAGVSEVGRQSTCRTEPRAIMNKISRCTSIILVAGDINEGFAGGNDGGRRRGARE